jgi:hypothetical protein
MNQITANQMEELVNKERMHNERLMSQDKISRMVSYNKDAFAHDATKAKIAYVKNIVALQKGDKENQPCNQEDKMKHQNKLRIVWSASKKFKSITGKDSDSMNKAKTLDKEVVAPMKNKFMKAAKITVMISQVKRAHDGCTCWSLDAKCHIHD